MDPRTTHPVQSMFSTLTLSVVSCVVASPVCGPHPRPEQSSG